MRVLIVSQYFHPENFRINQLALALKAGGHDVVIVTGQPNYPSGQFFAGYSAFSRLREEHEGMEVIRVPLYPRGRGRSWELVLNYISFVLSAIVFGLPRARGRFDVCVAWCSSPITIAIPAIIYRMFTRTPVAIWVQDLWPETFFAVIKREGGPLRRVLSAVVRWIYANVDQIWIQSPAYTESVKAHGGRDEQIVFVPNWAEDLYDGDGWSSVIGDELPPNSLVFAGNLGRAQGLENLIEAASIVKQEAPQVHWVFVGDGTLRIWLGEEVVRRELQAQVTFLPRRKPEDMPKVLKNAAATLVTLGGDQVFAMTIPSKVQSCLASGRPILATLLGEPARVIREAQAGYVSPADDVRGFAKTVKEFFSLPDNERARLGRQGHAYYKAHFRQAAVVDKIVGLLEKMSSKGRGSK